MYAKLRIFPAVCAFLLLAVSCQKEPEYAQDCSVEVIYSLSGLGDMGYEDNIYAGFRQCQQKLSDFSLESYFPKSLDEAEDLIEQWVLEGTLTEVTKNVSKRLLVVSQDTYASIFGNHPDWVNTPNNDILIIDSEENERDVYSIGLRFYGACYLAGEMVHGSGTSKAACVVANKVHESVAVASQGFMDGFTAGGGMFDEQRDLYSLGEGITDGFIQDDSLYHLSYKFAQEGYGFVFTVAGGSSQGLLRYTRQHSGDESCFYTNGMDVDQQAYSKRIMFSVVKKMDEACMDFMSDWLQGNAITKHQVFGLESGYVDVVPADDYVNTLSGYEAQREKSIYAENKFYGDKQ